MAIIIVYKTWIIALILKMHRAIYKHIRCLPKHRILSPQTEHFSGPSSCLDCKRRPAQMDNSQTRTTVIVSKNKLQSHMLKFKRDQKSQFRDLFFQKGLTR